MTKSKNHKIIYILVLTAALALALTSIAMANVWTDQPDYAPGSMVTISGDNSDNAGYVSGEEVQVEVWGPNGYHEFCNPPGVADDNGAWSCLVTLWDNELALGNYNYAATGQRSGVSQSGIFTDAAVRLKFATIGLPVETSVTVSWTRYVPGCNSTTGTGSTTFSAAGPSSQVQACELDGQNSFSYSFPASIVSGGVTYALSSSTPASGSAFTTDATITATYAQACTPPAVTTNPSSQSITYGSDASFTVAGTNYTGIQWQVSTDGGTTWSDITGANSLTYSLTKPGVSLSGNKYRAVLTGSCGSPATSNAATLTVNAAPVTMTAGSYSGMFDGSSHSPSACVVTADSPNTY